MNIYSNLKQLNPYAFLGAYNERLAKRQIQESRQSLAENKSQSERQMPEVNWEGIRETTATVEFSSEMQEIAKRGKEAALAREAEQRRKYEERIASDYSFKENLFEKRPGELWRIFSELLYTQGFYDTLEDEQVRQVEETLNNITKTMQVNRYEISNIPHIGGDWSSQFKGVDSMTSSVMRAELESSTAALNFFGENYLQGELKSKFQTLTGQYYEYYNKIAERHINSAEHSDETIATLPYPDTDGYVNAKGAMVGFKDKHARTILSKADRILEGREKLKQNYRLEISKFLKHAGAINDMVDSLERISNRYYAGNSTDKRVFEILRERNGNFFGNMKAYWKQVSNLNI